MEDSWRPGFQGEWGGGHGVTAEKNLYKMASDPDRFSLDIRFSNGIHMFIGDERVEASLNGEPLKVEGKYLIQSDLGQVKISFDRSNGEIWWVFEPAH